MALTTLRWGGRGLAMGFGGCVWGSMQMIVVLGLTLLLETGAWLMGLYMLGS